MIGRRLLAFLVLFVLIGATLPVLAGTATTAGDGATGTTVAGTTGAGGATATTTAEGETGTTLEPIVPAVTVEVTQPVEAQADWTYRYFIPTLLVLAALVVIMTVVQYFTRVVRNRYRVVR